MCSCIVATNRQNLVDRNTNEVQSSKRPAKFSKRQASSFSNAMIGATNNYYNNPIIIGKKIPVCPFLYRVQ